VHSIHSSGAGRRGPRGHPEKCHLSESRSYPFKEWRRGESEDASGRWGKHTLRLRGKGS